MTKSDLVEAIAATSPERTKRDVEGAVNTIFRAMWRRPRARRAHRDPWPRQLRVKERVERVGRNPKTGEMVRIPTVSATSSSARRCGRGSRATSRPSAEPRLGGSGRQEP
ncbi:MAG: HU family DNA-binding protein [bacterium]